MANKKAKFTPLKEATSKPLHFINGNICDPESGYVGKGEILVEDGKITKVSRTKIKQLPKGVNVIDCKGNYICPGLVDAQVHTGEPGGNYQEKLEDTSKAAVAGGITTINIMPNTKPAIDSTSMVEFIKNRAEDKAYCNVTMFGAATEKLEGKNLTETGLLLKAGVKGITNANNYIQNSGVFRKVCEYASNFDALVAETPIDADLAEAGIINEGKISTDLGVPAVPYIAEKIALLRDLAIAEETGIRYHAFNISTKAGIEILKEEQKKNKKISASTTPHHLSLNEEEANNYRTFAKIRPPLKPEEDRKALIKAIKDGVIEFICSKHAAKSEDQKRLPLQSAEFGVIGLETMLPVCLKYLGDEKFKLADIIRLLSYNSAKFLNLQNKGSIKEGGIADLILVDINKMYILDRESFFVKASNTAFEGKTLKGKILKTFVGGCLVYDDE